MDLSTLSNLTDPVILFFVLGLLAGSVRSNLEIPPPVTKFLSLYLLMAIGFKGGRPSPSPASPSPRSRSSPSR